MSDIAALDSLRSAYRDAKTEADQVASRYQAIRRSDQVPAEFIALARQQWAETRQAAIAAEYALRAAEDDTRIAGRGGRAVDALRWDPAGAVSEP